MATVLITGGTGMVGKHLIELLVLFGYDVIILSREKVVARRHASISYATWDINNGTIETSAIEKADYIVHLAGAGVADKRWTTARKKEIVDSRVKSSETLVKCLTTIPNHVKAVISASAIGWYGADTPKSRVDGFKEEAPADAHFLGDTCKQWEDSILPVEKLGIRLVRLRIGIVLSKTGGALIEFKKPLNTGVAAILGKGSQIISWIHVEDLCRMMLFALEHNHLNGAYNAVSPQPVTNKALTLTLAKLIKGKRFMAINVPSFILKIMLGEMSVEVLKSATVSNEKITHAGFKYQFATIDKALQDLQ